MDARLPTIALLALSSVLAACGGGPADDAAQPAAPSTAIGAEPASADAEEPATIRLDAQVHYAGFLLALDEATLADGVVTVTGTAENLGATSSVPPSNVTLALEAREVDVEPLLSTLPEVPGRSTGEVAYAFRVEPASGLDGGVLQIGGPDHARAIVPFGERGTLVDNQPLEVRVSGELVAGESTFTIEGGELRFDVPEEHESAEAGKVFLTVAFAVTNTSDFAGGYAFAGQDLRLETPSGTTLAPDDAPIELLQPRSTLGDLAVRWVIDADEPGTYTLVGLRNVGLDTEAEGRLTFEVPPAT